MKQRSSLATVFVVLLFITVIIFISSRLGFFKPIEPLFQQIIAPFQSVIYGSLSFFTGVGSSSKIKELEDKNSKLIKKIINQEKLVNDNKALSDQFKTQSPKSINLIPAEIIGAPGFLPGISVPEQYTVDKGEADGVMLGDAVVYKDNLVGKVIKTSKYLSSISLSTNVESLFNSKTSQTGALGVVKGQGGGGLILDNVVLSDTLKVGDMVITKGDINSSGQGIVPDLILGEIIAINKNPSDLFQMAKLKTLVDFSKISKVFIVNLR